MYSAFGVDHGYTVSKRKEDWTTGSNAGPGRLVSAGFFPGVHGLVAGKKGHKAAAAGHEFGPALAGSAVGVPLVGGMVGANAAQNKGYYKGSKAKKHAKPAVH
jgi:hypothetical protein